MPFSLVTAKLLMLLGLRHDDDDDDYVAEGARHSGDTSACV